MKKVLFVVLIMVLETMLIIGCIRKEEPKKDDFLGTAKTEEPKKPESRIKIIDSGGAWSSYQIIEVDGHQYLSNVSRGGIVHLESCPCKNK
jgi:hypothetical protein